MMKENRYRIIREISSGRNSRICVVLDKHLSIRRMMKEIRIDAGSGEAMRQRFIAEILIYKEMQHPSIPRIIDIISGPCCLQIIMELVEGENLNDYVLRSGPIPEKEIINWALQIIAVMRYLHEREEPVLHLDLKPANLILHPSGRIYLVDFGIALKETEVLKGERHDGELFRGTPGFAAPEQYHSGKVDARTDIYGLGRTMVFCLLGKSELTEDKSRHLSGKMYYFLKKCTARSREDRFQRMQEAEKYLLHMKKNEMIRGELLSLIRHKRNYFWMVPSIMILFFFVRYFYRDLCDGRAMNYVSSASESLESETALNYYKMALKVAPWSKNIYAGILEEYITPNHFTSEDAIPLLNILEETGALPVLLKQNKAAYGWFCYKMGIAYFYYMGGVKGKSEAKIWFSRAVNVDGIGLEPSQKHKLHYYEVITDYYRTFLSYGEDCSGENGERNFEDFYKILCNFIREAFSDYKSTSESDKDNEQMDFYLAAYEFAMEIYNYAEELLKESSVETEELIRILDQIEDFCNDENHDVQKTEENQLLEMVRYARKKIQILEEKYEKEEDISASVSLSDPLPASCEESAVDAD